VVKNPKKGISNPKDVLLSHAAKQRFQGEGIGEVPEWLGRLEEILPQLDPKIVVGFAKAVEETDPRSHIPQFAALHGLTPAETKLLNGLSHGQTVADYAKEQNISVNTARVHKQRILEKCAVRSQIGLLEKLFTFEP
jgi:DNA-binding NarL/FixJ family response regulator